MLNVGKMKDEMGGVAIEEFVKLKPKLYSTPWAISKYKKPKCGNEKVVMKKGIINIKMFCWLKNI